MARSDDFWSRPDAPAGGPDDFFGEPSPPPGRGQQPEEGHYGALEPYQAPDPYAGTPAPSADPPGAPPYERTPSAQRRARTATATRPGGNGRGGGSSGNNKKSKKRSIIWRWRRVFFIIGLAMMSLMAGGVAMVAQAELPEDPILQQASFICPVRISENCNAQNAMARISTEEDRVNVTLDQVPDDLINAVVAAEDREFFTHRGVDPMGIGRALYHDVKSGGGMQGGSTITQQLVKNSYLNSERTLTRKINEAVLSIKIEQSMSKDEILERYFNTIYFGRNAYGVQAASRVYFNKDVSNLGVREASYLAGLIRAPSLADVEKDPEEATRRRKTVLDAMLEEGYINQEQYDLVEATELQSYVVPAEAYRQNKTLQAPGKGMEYITEYVKRQLLSPQIGLTEAERDLGGLRVYTTIDVDMQTKAWNSIFNPESTDTPLNSDDLPEGALVAVDDLGRVRAMVGGRDPNGAGTNFAVRGMGSNGRPVGSTFKPIALAQAMQQDYALNAKLPAPAEASIPQAIEGCGELWEPGNYSDAEPAEPTIDLVTATQKSSNTAYANLMYELSDKGTNTQSVRDMAVRLGMAEDELSACLPIVLGASSSTPMEMAEVYATFANKGVHREPNVIERVERVDQDGSVEVLYQHDRESSENKTNVLTEEQANEVTYALQQVTTEGGTGHDAGGIEGVPTAGKTGTTQSNKDAWFVGSTPNLTAAVWVGYANADWRNPEHWDEATGQYKINPETGKPYTDEIPPMTAAAGHQVYHWESITGGTLPAKIWHTFMSAVAEPGEPVQLTPEQLEEGRPFEGIEQETSDTTVASTVPPVTTTMPPDGPTDTTMPPPDTTTTLPPDTTTTTFPGGGSTTSTTFLPPPPGRGDD
jgi:penicillin-binding protein 1A